ncbi:hypothetical protein [Aureispira anguillae]|uniref:Uncharacterized protein n=1 Tax=Aureispira anguillae TaxID=2864201 RepID=A0A915YGU3_9BACT|nr:hypothetical protein [Aureispira anguillae]BDS12898.1 hypothetical protein AsAng_0036230 [Aureispira anguillae]
MNRILIWTTILSIAICIVIKEYVAYKQFDVTNHLVAYGETRNRIHQKRFSYEKDWKKSPQKLPLLQKMAKEYLYKNLTDSVFGYWYGTTWDFNGITEQPRKGKIACGYFVTTTLEHCGFSLPRVKLAQQAASIIIRSLCASKSIQVFNKLAHLKTYMDKQEEGLYIVGLDTHVGYLWKTATQLYFVHASYSGNKQVSRELWNTSIVLGKSKLFVVGDLLGNKDLINHWIKGTPIAMRK